MRKVIKYTALALSILTLTSCSASNEYPTARVKRSPNQADIIQAEQQYLYDVAQEEDALYPRAKFHPKEEIYMAVEQVKDSSMFAESSPWVFINGNLPFFTPDEMNFEVFEEYGPVDELGRPTYAFGNISSELQPVYREDDDVGSAKVVGWNDAMYDRIDGGYLWHRTHLIGYQFTGENDNPSNFICGTQFLDVRGFRRWETAINNYLSAGNRNVLYRLTPIYEGDNLIASGVVLEAYSVPDNGKSICVCAYMYNCQPGVAVDYSTGESWLDENVGSEENKVSLAEIFEDDVAVSSRGTPYILDIRMKLYHKTGCLAALNILEKNKHGFGGDATELLESEYEGCRRCINNTIEDTILADADKWKPPGADEEDFR